LSDIDEHGAYAALGRVDLTLADLGKISVSANTYTQGFGTIEQRINERSTDNLMQFDAAASLDVGKLAPKAAKLSIPVYASINKTVRTPQYDPYDKDVKYKDKLDAAQTKAQRDSIKNAAIDQTTIKTINFTNVRVQPGAKTHLWSLSNFDVSYSYTKTEQSSPTVLRNEVVKQHGGFGYTYNVASKYVEPFKKMLAKRRSAWYNLIRDFNYNLKPSLLSFRADINRQSGIYIPRIVNTDAVSSKIERVDTTFDKYFTFDRYYNMRWDMSRSLNIDFSATNNARVDEPYGLLDTKAKKDTVRRNFWSGGRNTLYTQKATASYTFPLSKIPLTDWITARYSYTTTYNWIGGSRLPDALSLGNIIENSQENLLNGEFDFTRLYMKSRWLRALDNVSAPKPKTAPDTKGKNPKLKDPLKPVDLDNLPTKEEVTKGLTGKARTAALKKWRQQRRDARLAERMKRQSQPLEINPFLKAGGRLLTMVKRVSVNYGENYRSRLPGYMDSTKILGQNWNSMQPGLDYVFGRQPDSNWLNKKAAQGLITRDTTFNQLFRQNFEQRLSITAQLEPIKELTIDLNWDKTFSKEYTELFKDTSFQGLAPQHVSPYAAGGFSVSYISFKTLFDNTNPNEISGTFKKFEEYRTILSQRAAAANPYWDHQTDADGYAHGYGRYAQDVLIPSFIAAYTGKDPYTVALIKQSNSSIKSNPFSGIMPKPNWRVTYTGLTKIPALAKTFSSISLTHGYRGNLSMNSYTSALNFADPLRYGTPGFIDSSHNYVPFFLVPNITIQESFEPLIGVDVTTVNQLNMKFEYKKSRQLSLSLIDYQLSEVKSTEWTVGVSWRKRGFTLPFKLPFMKDKKLENDINFKIDLSLRDDINSNSRLDQSNAYGTGGQKVITIQPSIDYVLNNRVNVKLYFDQRRTTPYISTSAPTIATRAGFQVRVSLAP